MKSKTIEIIKTVATFSKKIPNKYNDETLTRTTAVSVIAKTKRNKIFTQYDAAQ